MQKQLTDIKIIKKLLTVDSQMSHREVAITLNMTRGEVWHAEERALKKIVKAVSDNYELRERLSEYLQ